jgi:homoserine kinase type II
MVSEVVRTPADSYGLQAVEITPMPVGPKVYYRITDTTGLRWFVKTYRDRTVPQQEHASIQLAEFARAGDSPVPAVRRTRDGKLVADTARVPMSVWQYVTDTETADGRLTGPRWQTIGAVVGRLHRHLATHPAAVPTLRPATAHHALAQNIRLIASRLCSIVLATLGIRNVSRWFR